MSKRLVALALPTALLLAACGHEKDGSGSSAVSSSSAVASTALPSALPSASALASAAPSTSASVPYPGDELDPNQAASESERKTLKSAADDPAVYKNRDFIADHYGVVQLPFPLQLQSVPLPHARRALLLTGEGPALEKPLILVTEASDSITWSKPRPLAGTRDKWRELSLSRGPHGEVFLFWYDEPTQIFAARAWTYEGGIFADFQVLTAEGCDATSVLYWPGHGWIAVLLHQGSLHAQLLGEGGTLKWSGNGLTTPVTAPRGTRPKISIASGKDVTIAVGARRVKISADGSLL